MQDDDTLGKGSGLRTQAEKPGRSSSKEVGAQSAGVPQAEGVAIQFAEKPMFKPHGGARAKGAAASAATKSELAEQIGVRLRGIYDDVLAQPVPERFLELLHQLEGTPYAPAKKGET